MEKPILVTNTDGFLLEHEVFYEPHKDWFKRAIEKTKDNSLKKWIGRKDYFLGVNEAMKIIMPESSREKQTAQAREWYQKDVIEYIKNHPEKVKTYNAKKLMSLKDKYQIILLTSNTEKYINKILTKAKLNNIYDGIISSKTDEEPSKDVLIDLLIKKYGKPKYYLTGKLEEPIIEKFNELKVKVIEEKDMNKL